MVSVFPNPTSSFATINIKKMAAKIFQYKLIYDQKIIYEDKIIFKDPNIENQIVIPAHSIQEEGTYIVAYEIESVKTFCQGTVPFMVMKNK